MESNTSEPPVSKKLYKRPKFFIGLAITILIDVAAIISQNEIAMWMVFAIPFFIGIALMFNKKYQDIGMGVIGGLFIPLLLFALLFGACIIGLGGYSLFH
ncbi:MAG: hypothetical protein HGB15_00195 [Chlorobaculum sp.]|nr:hypothetical protein [Chlorobaculum sp.]